MMEAGAPSQSDRRDDGASPADGAAGPPPPSVPPPAVPAAAVPAAAVPTAAVPAAEAASEPAPAASEPGTGSTANGASSSSAAGSSGAVELSSDAPVFVPGSGTATQESQDGTDEDDMLPKLPPYHRSLLRHGMSDLVTSEWYPFYVGRLKSFSKSAGYGFLACAQTYGQWRCDIFIHKSQVITPWHIGQPCEFGIQVNNRGQPQACYVNWLPRLPEGRLAPMPNAASPTQEDAASTATRERPEVPRPVTLPGDVPADASAGPPPPPERHLGTLKSFSLAQGYGFIASDALYTAHKRDVYFDKSQLPENPYYERQAVEFTVVFNKHNHPQARDINWNPIPVGVREEEVPQSASAQSFSQPAMEKLRKLRAHLNKNESELAIIAAIDMQGQTQKTPVTQEETNPVDFVTYVLDRLGKAEETVVDIKDFIRMLLLLMLAKMLRKPRAQWRTWQLVDWFVACATTIQPTIKDEAMKQFPEVVDQIKINLHAAVRENTDAGQDQKVSGPLNDAMRDLMAKAKLLRSQTAAAEAHAPAGAAVAAPGRAAPPAGAPGLAAPLAAPPGLAAPSAAPPAAR